MTRRRPQYSAHHDSVRRLYVERFVVGQPCAIGGEPLMCHPSLLDLAHATDEHGNRTGGYLGLACRKHNRGANAWGKLKRTPEGEEPQYVKDERAAAEKRHIATVRGEYDRVQARIAADKRGADLDGSVGRDWLPESSYRYPYVLFPVRVGKHFYQGVAHVAEYVEVFQENAVAARVAEYVEVFQENAVAARAVEAQSFPGGAHRVVARRIRVAVARALVIRDDPEQSSGHALEYHRIRDALCLR